MELILINDKKLKIMLTPEDMKEYELDCETVDYTQTETRRAFWNILDEAKHQTGFDAASERVYIQLFPSSEGGCELFVTKITREESKSKACTCGAPQRECGAATRRVSFCFSCQRDLLAACRRLLRRGFTGESQAMRDDSGRFWLFLFDRGSPLLAREEFSFLLEYGQMENSADAFLLLLEHGSTLCISRAVETLGVL